MRKLAFCSAAAIVAASAAPAGAVPARGVAPNGEAVAFSTTAALVAADQDGSPDVYVWRAGAPLELASVDPRGATAPTAAHPVFVSDDGQRGFFSTDAPLVPEDTDATEDVYAWSGGSVRLVGRGGAGRWRFEASADGRSAFFDTTQPLLPEDTDSRFDVYRWDDGVTTLVSASRAGTTPGFHVLDGVSSDGSRVFETTDEAVAIEDLDDRDDVYERSGAAAALISKGTLVDPAGGGSSGEAVSSDGSAVTFTSGERLEPGDADTWLDLYQRRNGRTRLLSRNSSGVGPPCPYENTGYGVPPCTPRFAAQSPDGAHTVFYTDEPLAAADSNDNQDFYDATAAGIESISGPAVAGSTAAVSYVAAVSDDGARRVFDTYARLTAGDTDSALDVYLREGGVTTLLSPGGSAPATLLAMAPDGSRIYLSTRDGLVPEDVDAGSDVYVSSGGAPALATTGPADDHTPFTYGALGAAGTRFFFATPRALVADDADADVDLYMRANGVTTLLSG
ncbi:MAG TPA: hypothetical protein VF712_05710 [Thermoleophilaceae bacterium]|jgi:hypothetical protein